MERDWNYYKSYKSRSRSKTTKAVSSISSTSQRWILKSLMINAIYGWEK